MSVRLSPAIASFFWEYRPDAIDLHRHAVTVIERLLEYGDDAAIRWVRAAYSADQIRNVVAASRRVSAKTRAFWLTVLPSPSPSPHGGEGRVHVS